MELSDFIDLGRREPALRFLIIGGYAVAAHGHTRATFDVDLLVRRAETDAWLARLGASGLKLFGKSSSFAQFIQPDGGDGLDLMFVDEATFERMWQNSEEHDFGGCQARVPCLDHLLALKLHVLKQELPYRTSKDAEDVELLARRNGLNLRDPRYETLFLKHGNQKFMKHSSASCDHREAVLPSLELNFPLSEGFRALPPLIPLAQLASRNRRLRRLFAAGLRSDEERWRAKSDLEFQL